MADRRPAYALAPGRARAAGNRARSRAIARAVRAEPAAGRIAHGVRGVRAAALARAAPVRVGPSLPPARPCSRRPRRANTWSISSTAIGRRWAFPPSNSSTRARRRGRGRRTPKTWPRTASSGHWGTDGSVPEQRFTEAGGMDMVLENSSCFTDEKARTLDRAPRIDARNVEQAEDMFFHEGAAPRRPPQEHPQAVAPQGGHRRRAARRHAHGDPRALLYAGVYRSVRRVPPRRRAKLRVGDKLHVEGTLEAPATFGGVGLARVDAPKPLTVPDLNRRRSYPVPAPYQMYWPPGYQTPIPVKVKGSGTSEIDVPVGDGEASRGMYELERVGDPSGRRRNLAMVSLRTFPGAVAAGARGTGRYGVSRLGRASPCPGSTGVQPIAGARRARGREKVRRTARGRPSGRPGGTSRRGRETAARARARRASISPRGRVGQFARCPGLQRGEALADGLVRFAHRGVLGERVRALQVPDGRLRPAPRGSASAPRRAPAPRPPRAPPRGRRPPRRPAATRRARRRIVQERRRDVRHETAPYSSHSAPSSDRSRVPRSRYARATRTSASVPRRGR